MTNPTRPLPSASGFSTLIDLLARRAETKGDQCAFTFLSDGEIRERSLTFAELERQARSIGALLSSSGAGGERVLLVYQPGLEYIAAFFGCLYAGAVAVPVYPPRPNQSLLRFESIVSDTQPALALTAPALLPKVQRLFSQQESLRTVRWLATGEADDTLAGQWRRPDTKADDLAFLQYTSGSTSAPRGVMVSHGNLLHNEAMIQAAFNQTESSIIVSWLPLFHDMGLIGNVIQPLYLGAQCILMSPVAFLQRPLRWLRAISDYKATTSGGPNFAYDLCVQKIKPAELENLDLSKWVVAFNGSEPVRSETLDRFAQTFEPCGFRREAFVPCYGLAEATLLVSAGTKERQPVIEAVDAKALEKNQVAFASSGEQARMLVSCGESLSVQNVIVVNPETSAECGPEQVGEIWVSGPSVTLGYWNRPELTEQMFRASLSGDSEKKYLRTGDLGFLKDGGLFITGRLKDLIVIRGLNHYPQDIEFTVERSHSSFRPNCGAAFTVDVDGAERLVVVQGIEPRAEAQWNDLIELIRQVVAENHEIDLYAVALVKASTIAKTSSGKIQRSACKARFLSGSLDPLASWAEDNTNSSDSLNPSQLPGDMSIEEWLIAQIAARKSVEPSAIDINKPLSRYGVDSLFAIELTHDLETGFGVILPIGNFLQGNSIAELVMEAQSQLYAGGAQQNRPLHFAPDQATEYALSFGQRSIWYLHQLSPDSAAYNIASAARVRGNLNIEALRRSFQALVDRHPSLRTIFTSSDGMPVQKIIARAEVCFQQEDAASWTDEKVRNELAKEAHRAFDLEQGPLFRVKLFKRQEEENILLVAAHHIIADFWSLAVITNDLAIAYKAQTGQAEAAFQPLTVRYTDYARWQAELMTSPEGERLRDYWLSQLSGELPSLNLPADRPRPAVQTYAGASHKARLGSELTLKLNALSEANHATLFMTLLAAFQTLLHRYSGQQQIVVGSPIAGRSRADLAPLTGYFVNPLVLRGDFSDGPTFATFLTQIRKTLLNAYEHQDYPFPLLVEQLQPERDSSRTPLFQVMAVLQKAPHFGRNDLASFALSEEGTTSHLGDLQMEPVAIEQQSAQFDLTLMMAASDDEILTSFQYNTGLFDLTTIKRMAGHFQVLLEAIVNDPDRLVSLLPLLTRQEEKQLLEEWNDTFEDYGSERFIHRIFEQRAHLNPHAIAVVCESESLSYSELNGKANQLAHYLIGLGVGPDNIIGVCLHRSLDMMIALLAILKAGAAYLPLDPDYPSQRLAFMSEDSSLSVVLTVTGLRDRLPASQAHVFNLDRDCERLIHQSRSNPVASITGDNIAYVIYTSGTTGNPKGAMNRHAAIANRLIWMQQEYALGARDVVLQKTPYSFDVSVWELFWPLMYGSKLVMAKPGGHRDADYLVELIAAERVSTIHFVPTMLGVFLEAEAVNRCESLRLVICSGEALMGETAHRCKEKLKGRLDNLYGPTEAAVDVTCWEYGKEKEERRIAIGKPIANTRVYILDEQNQPVAVGVAGELLIGGAGLARGYLNRPELTAEKFVPDEYGKAGERVYRTGDLVRWWPEGEIEFIGRRDQQVKVRGYRIELGEIEAALKEAAGVIDSVVVMREQNGDKQIVGYVVGDDEVSEKELKRELRQRVPEYMVPMAIVKLDRLPLTANGKVDRRALPAPNLSDRDSEDAYLPPRTPIEQTLAEIWSQVLGVERVSVNDNFFDLGGHSLLATQVASRVREAFKVDVTLSHLFASSARIQEMAAAVEQIMIDQAEADDLDEAFKELDGLTDEEVRVLLAEESRSN